MSNRLMTYERETQIRKTTKLQYTIHGRYVKYSMHADRLTELVLNVHVRIFLFLSKSSLILIKNFNLSGGGTDLVVVYTWRCLLLLLSRGTSSGKILWYHVLIMVRHCGCPDSGKTSWYPVLIIVRHCRCHDAGKTLWYPVIILASQNGTLYWFW